MSSCTGRFQKRVEVREMPSRRQNSAIDCSPRSGELPYCRYDWPEVLLKHGRRISVPFGWEHFSEGKLDPKCVFQRGLHVLAGEAAARRSGRRGLADRVLAMAHWPARTDRR